jgi:hypothetical protein
MPHFGFTDVLTKGLIPFGPTNELVERIHMTYADILEPEVDIERDRLTYEVIDAPEFYDEEDDEEFYDDEVSDDFFYDDSTGF